MSTPSSSFALPVDTDRSDLAPAARRTLVAGVLAAHVAGAWALLQIDAVREQMAEVAPIFVDFIAPPPPPPPSAPPPPRPVKAPPPPPKVIAAPPAPAAAPAIFTAPPPPIEAPPPAPPPVVVEAPPPAPPAPPAPPKTIPATSVEYLQAPAPVYPAISRRVGETGRVLIRVEIDASGRARQLQLHRSSGFTRLDEAALNAVRQARFKPYTENGVALVVWTTVPILFELE
jgi:periplasmic protein TonB